MSIASARYYRFLEGEISGLMKAAGIIDFRLGDRAVSVESTAVTATLREGERVRVLLQEPLGDAFFHMLAFQRSSDSRVHYTGPRLGLQMTVIGSLVLATGLYAGLSYLLLSGLSLFLLELLFSLEQLEVIRRFDRR